jgi:hypothetical protein
MRHDMQGLSATELVTLCSDGFTESQHQQPPHGAAYHHFTEATQDANKLGICAIDYEYSTQDYGGSFMSVDISRLIHGEYIFSGRAITNPA